MDLLIEQVILQFPVVAILLYVMFRLDGRLSEMQKQMLAVNERVLNELLDAVTDTSE